MLTVNVKSTLKKMHIIRFPTNCGMKGVEMEFRINPDSALPGFARDAYYVEIQVMHGGSDTISTFNVGPFRYDQHEANLENLLQTLTFMKERFEYTGMYGGASYRDVLGHRHWFSEVETPYDSSYDHAVITRLENDSRYGSLQEILDALEESFRLASEIESEEIYWPDDAQNDQNEAQYCGHEVFFIDMNGHRRSVTVTP